MIMRPVLTTGLALLLAALPAAGAHTRARLVLAAGTARAGDTVLAAIRLQMEPGWHTYWKNPGGSGMATTVEWDLPPGVTAGELQWPVPEKAEEEGLTTFVYENGVTLLAPLKLDGNLNPGPTEIKASLNWLECEVQCIPGGAAVQATLIIGSETMPSEEAPLFDDWQKQMPLSEAGVSASAWWEKEATSDIRPVVVEWDSTPGANEADFYPDASDNFEIQGSVDCLFDGSGRIEIHKQVKKLSNDWPREISGLLVRKTGTSRQAFRVKLPVQGSAPAAAPAPRASSNPAVNGTPSVSPGGVSLPLWRMLVYAFVGGLILNVMPCVLPVLSLKILGFVAQAKDHPREVRKLGFMHTMGVMVSFLALATLVVAVKASGRSAGWGMQFGNPEFLVVLTVLVTLVALNLFGLFEVNLGGRVMNTAGTLASKHGPAGAFFNGVLATVLATPCTAPFLGIALGFAVSQKAVVICLIFLTIGLGLALPYLVLSWHPVWLKLLPKPGAWMEQFKIAMGFPMLATAVWLASILPVHYGARAWWFGLFLVMVALAAWVFGQFVQRGRSRRGLGVFATLAICGAAYALVLEGQLGWRAPVTRADTGGASEPGGAAPAWQPWSPQAVAAARAQGRPVLVDFTAKWCVTCNTVVKPALENQVIHDALRQLNAVALLGDYTKTPEEMTTELNRFGRAGVPLVLIYPKNPDAPAIVLPEPSPLRPPSHYTGMILEALERAGG